MADILARRIWKIPVWLIFAVVMLGLEYFLRWQPIARECTERGGNYTLDGTCSKMTFQVIFTKKDLKQ